MRHAATVAVRPVLVIALAACASAARVVREPERRVETIPGTALSIELVLVPGDADTAPFWLATTETAWEAYDAFVYGFDAASGGEADAVSRPSKPYITMDRGFGHAGYPAISMSHRGAAAFCAWLAAKTGRPYRLPTEAEWERACAEGDADLDARAWHAGNAEKKTHPVGTKEPNAYGLHDLHGNAAEWCDGRDGAPVVRGGSYLDPPERVGCGARRASTPAWNASDPQLPKSRWWLADAGFVGFRVACDVQAGGAQHDDDAEEER